MTLRLLFLACLTNAAMGILYVWSLFLLPIEAALEVPRATLSLAPAFALVAFTVGMALHGRILRRLDFRAYALLAFGLASGGHLLFAWGQGLGTLLLGYGVLFGLGAGLGYGLALALVTRLPAGIRSMAMGLVMAAFAVSGVALSSLLAQPIQAASPAAGFLAIGLAIALVGLAVALLLPAQGLAAPAPDGPAGWSLADIADAKFLRLALTFFFICYGGLMLVAHVSGIVLAASGSAAVAGLAPGTFTLGYILGSLVGGKAVELSSGRAMLVWSNVLAGAGLLALVLPWPPLALAGALAVGAVFGGSASLMPVLIGQQYGTARIGDVYGRLMIAYGTAGLVAPALSGKLFSATGSYALPVAIAVAASACGAVLGLTMDRGASAAR
ncbi:Predicted arabinose efflux permease, MFS family [Paracoccus thiocyanatus]|uniref:Predicted arabinose efflux permease, MFS family n=1 Tax=Paracoccus thiocyanatus TaxID=34006 RepID=A0A1N6U763_9RHOB|nr:MFS transporter [Paracoccus thiocyanatus]SIQ61434.1 Predicted arabinose efflux permease, MFS family [Paracoccus thiocyanatus]